MSFIDGLKTNNFLENCINDITCLSENTSTQEVQLNNILDTSEEEKEKIKSKTDLFSVDQFKQDLIDSSAKKNKGFIDYSERFNAYDIAHFCIRTPLFRILKQEIDDYSDNWLPVKMRGVIGTACHDFIQGTSTSFTEDEVYLRIPSIKTSVKIDCLTGNSTLVEIKSCSYADYAKILKTNQARQTDFYQALLYKYLLETYIDESRNQEIEKDKYHLPKLDSYDIKTIQMIYVCHELFSSNSVTLDEAVNDAKKLKKQLNSKYNYMWFIKTLNYDLTTHDYSPYIDMLKDKIDELNKYLDKREIPPMNHKYTDTKKCFFCLYSKPCKQTP